MGLRVSANSALVTVTNTLSSPRAVTALSALGLFAAAALGIQSKGKALSNTSMKLAAASFAGLVAARHLHRREYIKTDRSKLSECLASCTKAQVAVTRHLILVNLEKQKLHVYQDRKWVASYPVSTSKNGAGQVENTGTTPLGLHQIAEKIGERASAYAIFKSRVDTGKTCAIDEGWEDFILGRILWLDGMEEGINKNKNCDGQVVDSKNRYIYIHGTNRVKLLGTTASSGCIRLHPLHAVKLYDQVPEKTLVYIYKA